MSESIIKKGYANNLVQEVSNESIAASPVILERLEKFARTSQVLAPKSNDFLYFTIIFLRAAEASLIDDKGNLRKVGSERAWGYFDKDFKWHGNVKPHKNNNGDIFPEIELKTATRDWIGMPLCVDHKSESVDGIRGIILDTYYDEKHKQVVGLCALDKINYPNLARKVQTGVVRYGSMGTAVTTSICSDCGNRASTPTQYCRCVTARSAYGEINIGLKPIEYSLVVQPAEPGARLLQCLASIGQHKKELINNGVRDYDEFAANLSLRHAEELDQLLKVACGPSGCSLKKRASLIGGYLHKKGFVKQAQDSSSLSPEAQKEVQFAKALSQLRDAGATEADIQTLYTSFGRTYENEMSTAEGETFTSGQSAEGASSIETFDSEGVRGTGGESTGLVSSDNGELIDSFDTGGVGPESYAYSSLDKDKTYKNIMGEIMKESNLQKRAEFRRRIAYYYGGASGEGSAEPVEPSTFTSEDYKKYWMDDKHMHQDGNMGGDTGTFPGDMQIKEQQKRAKLAERRMKRRAYFYGGASGEGSAEPVEPSTFTSEDYKKYWMDDKHMHQDGNMGGDSGTFPGDMQIKEQQKRARLSTKFKTVRALNGNINKAASCFEVYADGHLILATTAKDIYGPKLGENWKFLTSRDYGKAVVAAIREEGLPAIAAKLTRKAQGAPLPELGGDPGLGAEAPLGEPLGEPLGDEGLDAPLGDEGLEEPLMEEGLEDEGDPQSRAQTAVADMEATLEELQSVLEELGAGGSGDVEINVGTDEPEDVEKVALSRKLLRDLQVVKAEASESADELALIAEAFDHKARIPRKKMLELKRLAADALSDSAQLTGEARTLIRMARVIRESMIKTSEYVEEAPVAKPEGKIAAKSSDEELMKKALSMRKQRRLAMLAKARKKLAMEEEGKTDEACAEDHEHDESCADDGAGGAQRVADATPTGGDVKAVPGDKAPTGTPREVAERAPTGNQANDGFTGAVNTADDAEIVANKAPTGNQANDGAINAASDEEIEDIAEHEEEKHDGEEKDENEANDVVPNDGVQEAGFVTEQVPSPRAALGKKFMEKKAEEEREGIKLRMRRAYDLAMDMQRKGLIPPTKAALDSQVDLVLDFDVKAFEAFRRSVANARTPETIKIASDLGGVNIGYEAPENIEKKSMVETLSSLFN